MTVVSFQAVEGPFQWLLEFALPKSEGQPERRETFRRTDASRREAMQNAPERECRVLAGYQMSCLAQQLSIGGFDVAAGVRCSCEHSSGHCIERNR
jgi:hypothetical protein